MQIRDRIKELRRVPAAQLRPNPRNWRTHSTAQREALQGVLAEVGYAGALLARELPDGALELLDGHLRAETTPDALVPVLIVDVDEREAAIILATHDPLAGMAGVATTALESLLAEVDTNNPAVQAMWADLAKVASAAESLGSSLPNNERPELRPVVRLHSSYQVVIECVDEGEQQAVYEQLVAEGRKCRLLML